MKQRFTLVIRDFGRIASAELEVAPLTILIGKNNAGKSYALSLLWGLFALGKEIFPPSPPASAAYRDCETAFLAAFQSGTSCDIDPAPYIEWFNECLKTKKKFLVETIFQNEALTIGTLRIERFNRTPALSLRRAGIDAARYSTGKDYVQFPDANDPSGNQAERYRMIRYLVWKLVMDELSSPMFSMGGVLNAFSITGPRAEALFLPASRTGFMLTYKALVTSIFSAVVSGTKVPLGTLPLPVSKFIAQLIDAPINEHGKFAEIADLLQKGIAGGVYTKAAPPLDEYRFIPDSGTELPLSLASSTVTEIAPLVLFLKARTPPKSLFIEEPEAHLHLEAQRRLVRVIARMVNSGLPVFITTHSDSLAQQINNSIRLDAPQAKELRASLNYAPEETLATEDVAVFEFSPEANTRTVVKPALRHPDGSFALPSFNLVLGSLLDESLRINEAFEEKE